MLKWSTSRLAFLNTRLLHKSVNRRVIANLHVFFKKTCKLVSVFFFPWIYLFYYGLFILIFLMNIIQHYPITPYESPIPLKYGHSRKLNRKRVVKAFYNYAGLLLEDYFCTLLFGSILFDPTKSADEVWEDVDEALKKLREILFKQANVADVWVTVEIHRSHSHRKNSLAGRPHFHFIVSYACHEHLGPTPSRLLSTLRENFYDVQVRRVKKTQKEYLTIFRECPYFNGIGLSYGVIG